ncbi:hypothetical protein CYMTET_55449 [Cymbomonas tetramitiformis]|uniref:G-protein coupled receptors family 2 profile 2 domain-containing protein n=1 Tax=Cymbomonas tetramitiformis TaxID=36881 RepID=A0AAE0BDB5_9CHLO|nr:hypothetical protein CYMTET_55449 [Cymbomonas tetramitiformis]
MASSLRSPLLSSRSPIADVDAVNPLRGDAVRQNHPTERVAGLKDVLLRKNVLIIITLIVYAGAYCIAYYLYQQQDEAIRLGQNPKQATYQIAGGSAGLLSCLLVMLSYLRNKRLQRHPNNLIFWRTLADALNATLFLIGGAVGTLSTDNTACKPYSVLRELFFLSSEGWFFAMCLDLWHSSVNPFFSFKNMMRWYHVMAWTMGAIFAIMLWLTGGYGWTMFGTTTSSQSFCWVKNMGQSLDLNNFKTVFIYLPVALIYIVIVILLVASFLRLRHGRLPHTFRTRLHVLVLHSMNVMAYGAHWVACTLLYWSLHWTPGRCTNEVCGATFIYVLTSKGVMNLVVWVLTNEPELMFGPSPLEKLPGDSDEVFEEQDDSYKPQVNQALQAEVMHYLTEGIMTSTRILGEDPRRIAEREMDLNKNDLPPIGWTDILDEIYCISFGWNRRICMHQPEARRANQQPAASPVQVTPSSSGALLRAESAERREAPAAAFTLEAPAKGSEPEKAVDQGRGGLGPEHEDVGFSTPTPSENGEAAELQTEGGAEIADRDAEVEARGENSATCAAACGGGHVAADVKGQRAPDMLHSPEASSQAGGNQKVKFISYQEEEFQSVRHHCGITEEGSRHAFRGYNMRPGLSTYI